MNNGLKIKRLWKPIHFLLILFVFFGTIQDVSAKPKKYPLGDIPLSAEAYQKHIKKTPHDMAALEAAVPSSYDARSEGIVTEAKNQLSCGSCWAFATVGALESHLLKAGMPILDPDLSEQQQVSCNTAMGGCSGGNSYAIRFWEDKGPLDEDTFPYTGNDYTACVSEGQLGFRVVNYHTVPTTTADFKDSLYTNGPSYWRYDVHTDFFTFWGSYNPGAVYVNQARSLEGGHAVLLIGWDDAKQAFLCKNSWGTTGGPNGDGTFWIAYDGHATDLGFGMANFNVTSLTCTSDTECSDGVACNGSESCVDGYCQAGTPVNCPDNGLFCDGSEYCQEPTGTCASTDDACSIDENCIEDSDICEPLTCRNGICEQGEDCMNCPSDCLSGSGGGSCDVCFKGKCDGNCHPNKEDSSCTDCAPSWCCGDGVCNGAEDTTNCLIDCGCVSDADCNDGQACTSDICSAGVCENIWPSCGLIDGCCPPSCTPDLDLDCQAVDCSACFKGTCDGVCHPVKEDSLCPDCQ